MTTDTYTRKDFESSNEVRWCPGCGDYAVLASVLKVLPQLGIAPENHVFVSGIGCSSRFPYYLNTYGYHTIHGRAPTIASGLKISRPELSVWVITGDGDGLSIGANHLLHLMRRNINVTILLFNNQIYGLTKGQYSPTSQRGQLTKTSPMGVCDEPLNPLQLGLAANCSFMARAIDIDGPQLQQVLIAAHQHQGTSLVEIYQNCNVFNDGAFSHFADRGLRAEQTLAVVPGKPLIYGKEQDKGLRWSQDHFERVPASEATCYQPDNMTLLQGLLQLDWPKYPICTGILRQAASATYQTTPTSLPSHQQLEALFEGGNAWVR